MAFHDRLSLDIVPKAGTSCGVAENSERQAPRHILEDVLARPILRRMLYVITRRDAQGKSRRSRMQAKPGCVGPNERRAEEL